MNEYPPANYIAEAMAALPAPGPEPLTRIVDIDARPSWGLYRLTFLAKLSTGYGTADYWFWTVESGKRIAEVKRSRLPVGATTCSAGVTPVLTIPKRPSRSATVEPSLPMTSRPTNDQRPPSNYLAAAIKRLPKPGADVPQQRVVISVQRSGGGTYEVTFVARRNPKSKTLSSFWGIQSSRRLPPA